MSHIHHLSPHVISTIAAGEIAERPAIIVKELLENALDAQATQITISLDQGGLNRIVVSDNGHGMDQTDLELAVQRHTTSKILSAEDISTIATFGFRGEALASIGSVARLTIQSKPPTAPIGYQIVVENSVVESVEPVGMPDGTTITVEHLFAALPARRKFLKQPQTELKHSLEIVTAAALSHPDVHFQLFHNRQQLLNAPSHPHHLDRAALILGQDTSVHLLPLEFEQTFFKVHGFLGKPQLARRGQPQQYLYINRRFVSHPPINRAIKDVYGSLIEPKAEPLFILNIELPQPLVDINVHPRKETVKFIDEGQILELIKAALQNTFAEHDLTYRYTYPTTHDRLHSHQTFVPRDRTMSRTTGQALKEAVIPWHFDYLSNTDILQIHNTYLLAQSPEGLLLVDQHAAHERILYEQFLQTFEQHQAQGQQWLLPNPHLLEVSLSDAQILNEHTSTLQELGFELEEFGKQTFKISAIPPLLKDRDLHQLFNELIGDLHQGRPVTGLDSVAQRTIAYLSCRQAVKAGDPLTLDQRRQLLEKLASTTSNFTCPHGRPVSIICDLRELEKMFKRSGF